MEPTVKSKTRQRTNWARKSDEETSTLIAKRALLHPESFSDKGLWESNPIDSKFLSETSARAIDPMKKWM